MIEVTGVLHVTIVTHDLPRLETFYRETFGAAVVQRLHLASPEFGAGTGVPGARAETVHLSLGGSPVVLEITQYREGDARPPDGADVPGLRHVALAVPDMEVAMRQVRELGVAVLGGGPVQMRSPGRVRGIAFVYVLDPDGNIVELVDTSRRGVPA